MDTKRISGNSLMTDGIISFLAGLMLFFFTGASQSFIVFAFGAYAVILGIVEMAASRGERDDGRSASYLTLLASFSIIAGILLTSLLDASFNTVLATIATYVTITGIAEMIVAFRYRSEMGGYAWFISAGIVRILFGMFLFINTSMSLSAFVVAFATYALIEGIAMSIFGYEVKYQIGKHSTITIN